MRTKAKTGNTHRTQLKMFGVLLFCLGPLLATNTFAEPTLVSVGGQLPDHNLRGLNGPTKPLVSYRGKPLIINVWASWCGPCRDEMASLEQLAWVEGIDAINIIGVSTDDYVDRARAFLSSRNTAIRHYIDQGLVIEKFLGADRLPLTVLVDASGHVVTKVVGARDWSSPTSVSFVKRTLLNNKESKQ